MQCVHALMTVLTSSLASRRKRKPSLEDSYSDISSVSSSSDSDVSMEEEEEGNTPSPPSLAAPTTSKIVETDSNDEESSDDSDIYEQFRKTRKLSVNSVYSDKDSSEEDMEERDISQKVESSPPIAMPVLTDHIYAKPPKSPEAQNDNDNNVVVEINEEDERLKREELLTAQARQHSFPTRSAEEEDRILQQIRLGYGPDKEDVEMFKLALKRLKEEKDELVSDVSWAYYPSDILFDMIIIIVFCKFHKRLFNTLLTNPSLAGFSPE